MAPHSSTLAWEIPWMEEPGRLQSIGSWRVRHDWATSLSLFTFLHWRRKWQPTPVCLPGESQGREPGGPPSMGSHRVGHDWRDLAAACKILQRIYKYQNNENKFMYNSWMRRFIITKMSSFPILNYKIKAISIKSQMLFLWNLAI